MRITVVGAGVMGLSAARVLAHRGHDVVCIDQFGIGNAMASSPGATRIWRLAHPDRRRVRLARWNSELWQRLEEQAGRSLRLHRGLLWRGGDAADVQTSLAAEGVEHEMLNKAGQDKKFPEMRWAPDRLVVWQPEAGVVLAAETLQASAELFAQAGGRLVQQTVTSITPIASGGVRVNAEGGATDTDCVVVAAGPWASSFLQQLAVEVRLRPVLEQVTYVRGGAGQWHQRPCVIDVPEGGGSFGCYAMPTPGVGYKIGVDEPISTFDPTSTDRTPDANREQIAVEWVSANLPGLDATPVRSEVCSWTDSPDGQFILDRVGDVVIGCGDSGQGFKFLPMLGEILADLAEGRTVSADVAGFDLRRLVSARP